MLHYRKRLKYCPPAHVELLRVLLQIEGLDDRGITVGELGALIGKSERTGGRLIGVLEELGFATYDGTDVQLTELGRSRARSYDRREQIVAHFFADVLGLPLADLRDDASRLAVVLPEKLVDRMATRTKAH